MPTDPGSLCGDKQVFTLVHGSPVMEVDDVH